MESKIILEPKSQWWVRVQNIFLQNQPCNISIFGRVPKLASLEQLDVVCIHFKNSGLGLGSKPGYANSAKQKRTQPAGGHLPKMFFIKLSTLGQSNIDLRPQTLKQSFFKKSFQVMFVLLWSTDSRTSTATK